MLLTAPRCPIGTLVDYLVALEGLTSDRNNGTRLLEDYWKIHNDSHHAGPR